MTAVREKQPIAVLPHEIVEWRHFHGMSQTQAAEALGVARWSVTRWEREGAGKTVYLAMRSITQDKVIRGLQRLMRHE